MKRIDITALLKQVEPHRNEVVEVDGVPMPKSAAMLLSGLANEGEWNVRYQLYTHAISECGFANNTATAVKLAQAHHQEARNYISLMILSRALIENNDPETGLLRAKEALELAIQMQVGINNAAGNLVRLSVKTGSVERVNEAMEALVDSADVPRTGDCVLDADWCDKAEALGADIEMISWIREAAAAQTEHMKRRRSERASTAPDRSGRGET